MVSRQGRREIDGYKMRGRNRMSTGGASGGGDIFDVKRIRRLIELMNEYELAEIDLRQSEQRIRLRKGPEGIVGIPQPIAMSAAAPKAAASAGESAAKPAKPEDAGGTFIKS